MNRLEAGMVGVGAASARSRGSMMQFGMQMNDIGTMAMLGAPPMQIFASQIGQVVQVAQMAEGGVKGFRSEEHTSELQSLMRISYAVFCLKKKKRQINMIT